ncbi:pirin family protein [Pontibacter vulgaris]|uniref:pirin family protein n=1 Tax=Pontibacter vulgaris TaxID=2905679 RepID=UPI001FA79919|nr:pirin family protein [Pontibacter vulgaris]
MSKNRTVERLLYAEKIDMGGFPVRQAFPTQHVEQIDPFLLLHHAVLKVPEGAIPHKSGVDPHPHRGFSPVTFVYKGGVHHRDSRGNDSVVYAGGTQWMKAGMGVVHSERPPKDIHEHGGEQEIIQLWVNLPKANKMDQPAYYPLQAQDTPVFEAENGNVRAGVVAGNFEGISGPIKTPSPVLALRIDMKAGATYTFPIPESYNAFLYLLHGKISVEGFGLSDELHAVVFKRDGTSCTFTALKDTQALLMAGKPLEEPLASHGPFVMNTQSEIMQAMRDYQMGKMGMLIE